MMDIIGIWVLPVMVVLIVAFGLFKRVRVFDLFMSGAKKDRKSVV